MKKQKQHIEKPAPASIHQGIAPKWAGWGIFILALLLYANTLSHDFVLDDGIVITKNTLVLEALPVFFPKIRSGVLRNRTLQGRW
jgi:hypothetical protein